VRWLAGALEGYTKLIVTAGQYALLEETFEIARALQPAMIVLEDIDLVGGHRDGPFAARGAMLNLLLNEMDGLAPEARMLFVLTTNRPECSSRPLLHARAVWIRSSKSVSPAKQNGGCWSNATRAACA